MNVKGRINGDENCHHRMWTRRYLLHYENERITLTLTTALAVVVFPLVSVTGLMPACFATNNDTTALLDITKPLFHCASSPSSLFSLPSPPYVTLLSRSILPLIHVWWATVHIGPHWPPPPSSRSESSTTAKCLVCLEAPS
jgi:hypothetical protein